MIGNKKILALVPARGGSKGIKNKNLKKIKNKTLIQITSEFIDSCKFFDYKILNSDSKRILNLGKKLNFLNFDRPKHLSGDRISDYQILDFTIKKMKKDNIYADYLIYLQPTSPMREKKHLTVTLKKIIKNNLDGGWSVNKIDKKFHPLKILIKRKNKLSLFSEKGKKIVARQMLNDAYIRNGVFYIFSIKQLKKQKTIYLKNMILSNTNYNNINIDTYNDLKSARKML